MSAGFDNPGLHQPSAVRFMDQPLSLPLASSKLLGYCQSVHYRGEAQSLFN